MSSRWCLKNTICCFVIFFLFFFANVSHLDMLVKSKKKFFFRLFCYENASLKFLRRRTK